ncbi:hypothetical protein [Paenibacillus dendritiformis]|uniref:Asparagine synthetase domain-containing protein n=1 Tax=Paenibacillus dendritiformis C454 TaxID=1131935 RepID=H3S9M0_9BACL|nr:hypothetical protein [Paenibacillus dendritiformis]EHQ64138.1 hypothetical protein PDENDC454_00995 [Paenibacillus dendritiformis C454]CAH8773277.1 hypothetical protein H7S4_006055 [Paenibacillus dendritiformis]
MSAFLARFKRSKMGSTFNDIPYESLQYLTNWSDLFPFTPCSEKYYQNGNSELLVFSFDAALDRNVVIFDRNIVFIQGYGDHSLEERFYNSIEYENPSFGVDFNESFAGVVLKENSIYAYSSITGVEHLFIYETKNEVVLTNRFNLFVPWLKNVEFRKEAFMWMAGRYHIGDDGTYFEGISRLKPAHLCVITNNDAVTYSQHKRGITKVIDSEVPEYLDAIIKYFSSIFSGINFKKRLWLSGGKDSRAILGLMDAAGALNNEISIQTFGELYSPDVMSATKIVDELGLAQFHSVIRPSTKNTSFDFSRNIAKDLYLDSMGCSLADIKNVSNHKLLIIGGHENGFKAKANKLPLEEYIQSRKYWVDAINILNKDHQESLFKVHAQSLREVLTEIPESRYAQVDSIHFRNSTYVGSAMSISHLGCSEVHPFLDGRMYKLLINCSDDILNSQFIHYYLCSKASAPIEAVSFANDKWPDELQSLLKKSNLEIRKEWDKPYLFNPNFPSQKNFGMYNWRLNLTNISSTFVYEYILSHRDYFDFINFSTFDSIMKVPMENLKFNEVYARLALLKMSLVHHFGLKALSFSNINETANEISKLLESPNKTINTFVPESNEEKLEARLYENEKSIAKLVDQLKAQTNKEESYEKNNIILKTAVHLAKYNDEISLSLAKEILNIMNFSELDENGIILTLSEAQLNSSKLTVEIEIITSEVNRALVAIRNNPEGQIPNGFILSDRGFYYKYLNPKPSEYKCTFEMSLTEKKLSDIGDNFELILMPWYNEKPIFIGKIDISTF